MNSTDLRSEPVLENVPNAWVLEATGFFFAETRLTLGLTTLQIQDLPTTYDEEKYMRFISYYGTHIITYIQYGGQVTLQAHGAACLLRSGETLCAFKHLCVHLRARAQLAFDHPGEHVLC